MLASLFIAPVLAVKPTVTYDSASKYTRYVGELGGAPYEILMPDNWNGHLVIGCRGFVLSTAAFPSLDTITTHQMGLMFMNKTSLMTGANKFAYAQSLYDQIGFCMQAGMLHTHQLTEYVIDNFHVTGKVFLVGLSMGGQIANMLVDKYPGLYAGVLDVCGNKDTTAFYNYWRDLANQPNAAAVRTYLNGAPTNISTLVTNNMNDTTCLAMKTAALQVMADVKAECGGTPETKPQAYDRLSPTLHPNLPVPVVSMVARIDFKVPIQHFNAYYDAVSAAGCLGNYRSYLFIAQHGDATIMSNLPTCFMRLFNWVNGGTIPDATGKPLP